MEGDKAEADGKCLPVGVFLFGPNDVDEMSCMRLRPESTDRILEIRLYTIITQKSDLIPLNQYFYTNLEVKNAMFSR